MKKYLVLLLFASVTVLFAWGGGHTDHADLVMQKLPDDIRTFFIKNGVKNLKKWSHFPDGLGKLNEDKSLDFLPKEDLEFLDSAGIERYGLHKPAGKAASFYLLTEAFRKNDAKSAQFYAGCLLHATADAAAFNHGPLVQTYTYFRLKHIHYPFRREYFDLSCMRKEVVLRQMIYDKLKDFKPAKMHGSFEDVMMKILLDEYEASGLMCQCEHKLLMPPPECFQALTVIADYQVRTGTEYIMAAWNFAKQGFNTKFAAADFSNKGKIIKLYRKATAELPIRDPALDAVYDGLFNRKTIYPALGIVCEGTAVMEYSDMGYGARFLAACTARSLIRLGFQIQMISVKEMNKFSFDPQKLPVLIFCGHIPGYARKAVKSYQDKGGKLILVGGEPPHKSLKGFPPASWIRRRNDEVPVAQGYGEANKEVWRSMKALSSDGKEYSLKDNPNKKGWSKPVCIYSVQLSKELTPLWNLNNGKETFCVAAADSNMVWLPAYFLMPFLFSDDPGMTDWSHPELDSFGTAVMCGAIRRFIK